MRKGGLCGALKKAALHTFIEASQSRLVMMEVVMENFAKPLRPGPACHGGSPDLIGRKLYWPNSPFPRRGTPQEPAVTPIVFNGSEVSVAHLAPFRFTCPCTEIKRELVIHAAFANHCYTAAFDAAQHASDDIVLHDGPSRPRVFDLVRYELSHQLPAIIADLPGKRVNQTTAIRNYVYAVPLAVAGQVYEVFFQLQRARGDGIDLRLTVESAYPVSHPIPLPKRPSSIRFNVLAYKVFAGKGVKFAPR